MLTNLTNNLNILFRYNFNINSIKYIINKYNGNDWNNYITNTESYSKSIIYKNKQYELLLISWKKDTETKYHNHPKNGCYLKVIEGELLEINKINNEISYNLLTPSNDGFKKHNEYHKIIALKDSYSLHLYSPPNFYKN
jgi:hypothetical protein